MSQSFQNIIINDEKHIFDLNKSHKDNLKKVVDPILSIAKYVYNIPSGFRVSTMKYRFRLQKGVKFSFFMSLHPLKCISIHVWRLSVLESHRSKVDDFFQYSMFWCCFQEIFPGPFIWKNLLTNVLPEFHSRGCRLLSYAGGSFILVPG